MINWYFIISSISQAFAFMWFPPIYRLGTPFSIIVFLILYPLCIYVNWINCHDDNPLFPDLKDLVEAEGGGTIGRTIIHIGMVIVFHLTWLYMYRHDWWHMTDGEWLFMYVNTVLVFYCTEKSRQLNTSR